MFKHKTKFIKKYSTRKWLLVKGILSMERKVREYRNIEELTSSIIEEVGILKASSAICSFWFDWIMEGSHVGKDAFKRFWCGRFCFLDPWITFDWNQKSGRLLPCINNDILSTTLGPQNHAGLLLFIHIEWKWQALK